jgi:hypothetical protein
MILVWTNHPFFMSGDVTPPPLGVDGGDIGVVEAEASGFHYIKV